MAGCSMRQPVLTGSECACLQISPLYATVFVASMLFPALSTIFKEQIFTKAKETLKGKQLDIFVVRSCCCQLTLSGRSVGFV